MSRRCAAPARTARRSRRSTSRPSALETTLCVTTSDIAVGQASRPRRRRRPARAAPRPRRVRTSGTSLSANDAHLRRTGIVARVRSSWTTGLVVVMLSPLGVPRPARRIARVHSPRAISSCRSGGRIHVEAVSCGLKTQRLDSDGARQRDVTREAVLAEGERHRVGGAQQQQRSCRVRHGRVPAQPFHRSSRIRTVARSTIAAPPRRSAAAGRPAPPGFRSLPGPRPRRVLAPGRDSGLPRQSAARRYAVCSPRPRRTPATVQHARLRADQADPRDDARVAQASTTRSAIWSASDAALPAEAHLSDAT